MNITVTITSPVIVPPIVTPPSGEYYKLLWDFETAEYGGGVRPAAPCPATMKSLIDIWIPMPEAFQWWLWEVWNIFKPAGITDQTNKNQWDGYWDSGKAWTNKGNGSDVCASYPTGRNLDQRPMAREQLASRGMTVKLLDGWTASEKLNNLWWPFDAIKNDAHLIYTPADFAQMWWLCGYATVQTTKKLTVGYQVDRFPNRFNVATGQSNDVFCPLLSRDGTLWFRKDRIRYMGDGVRANPYNPSRALSPAL
jgi:hypothetical protein